MLNDLVNQNIPIPKKLVAEFSIFLLHIHPSQFYTYQAIGIPNDKQDKADINQMDQGLRFLDTAINEATKGEVGAATEAARKALKHFKQAK